MPYASCSFCCQAAPTPQMSRPPEITSTCAAIFASTAGCRYVLPDTIVPTRSLGTAAAGAARRQRSSTASHVVLPIPVKIPKRMSPHLWRRVLRWRRRRVGRAVALGWLHVHPAARAQAVLVEAAALGALAVVAAELHRRVRLADFHPLLLGLAAREGGGGDEEPEQGGSHLRRIVPGVG